MPQERICLGVVVGAHGIKGEVKVKSFTEYPEDVVSYGELEDKSGKNKFSLDLLGFSKELLRVRVKGVDNRDKAEELKGVKLFASRSVLDDLEDDNEFYHADLIGLKAFFEDGELLGEVVAIYDYGAGDIVDIMRADSNKSVMVPFTEKAVPVVDIKAGKIIVDRLSGYFDEETKEDEDTSVDEV